MGKKKNKGKKSLTVAPFVDEYARAESEDAREERLANLSSDATVDAIPAASSASTAVEPEPESQAGIDHYDRCAASGMSKPERLVPTPPETEMSWEEVDAYLTGTGAAGKGHHLLVRGDNASSADHAHWDSRISTVPELKTLEITGTSLCTLPAHALGALAELCELRLPNNALLELPDVLLSAGAGLPLLQVIDVSSNRLRSLPSSIVRLPKLQVINAAANELVYLPDLSCLAALKTLNITRNAVAALPAHLPPTLSVLLAAENKLKELPAALGLCATLSELDVSKNLLSALPPTLADCVKLKSLRCADQNGIKCAWIDRKLGKLLQQEGKVKPILNHLRYGTARAFFRTVAF
jgi:Leucine-rich repeat (LRR) protein